MVSSTAGVHPAELVLPHRVVLLDDPYNQPDEGRFMQFRLTYEGLLLATQRDPITGQQDKRGSHKHDIRQAFHGQLKRLWEVVPHLRDGGERSKRFGYGRNPSCSRRNLSLGKAQPLRLELRALGHSGTQLALRPGYPFPSS